MEPEDIIRNSIQLFPNTDEKLKLLGEIFSSDTSRTMMKALSEREMTVMQVSEDLGFSANLIIYHLKKMMRADVVYISRQAKNSRGHPLRFYRAKSAILILANNAADHANKNKSFWNMLEKITRFSVIGIAGAFTWIITNSHLALESAFKYPRPTLPPYMSPIEPQASSDPLLPAILACGIIALGLLINCYLPKFKLQSTLGRI